MLMSRRLPLARAQLLPAEKKKPQAGNWKADCLHTIGEHLRKFVRICPNLCAFVRVCSHLSNLDKVVQ